MLQLEIGGNQLAISTRSINQVRAHDITLITGYLAQALSSNDIHIPTEYRARKKGNIISILDTILHHLVRTNDPENSLLEGAIPRGVFPNFKREFCLMDLLGNNKFIEFSTNPDILLIELGLYDTYYGLDTGNTGVLSVTTQTLRKAIDIVFYGNNQHIPKEERLGRYLEFKIKDGIVRLTDAAKLSTRKIEDIIKSVQDTYDELILLRTE